VRQDFLWRGEKLTRYCLPLQPAFQRDYALYLLSIYGKGGSPVAADLQGTPCMTRSAVYLAHRGVQLQALQLLEYLVKHGSERVVDDARSHVSTLKMLRSFHYIDEKGKDQGVNGNVSLRAVTQLYFEH
jgi:ENTH domain